MAKGEIERRNVMQFLAFFKECRQNQVSIAFRNISKYLIFDNVHLRMIDVSLPHSGIMLVMRNHGAI